MVQFSCNVSGVGIRVMLASWPERGCAPSASALRKRLALLLPSLSSRVHWWAFVGPVLCFGRLLIID